MKKFLSAIMTVVMGVTGVFSLQAGACVNGGKKDVKECPVSDYDSYPLVLIRGMDLGGLYYKLGSDEEEKAFSGINAWEIVKTVVKALTSGVYHRDLDKGIGVVIDYLNDIFGKIACNKDGSSKYDVSVPDYPLSLANYPELWDAGDENEMGVLKTACQVLGAKNVFYYNYDWRLDPFVHADRIDALVREAKKETGKDKVNIICYSLGGIMTDAYMYKYGHKDINRVMFMSATFCGTYVTSDLLNGRVRVDPYALYRFADKSVGSNPLVSNILKLIDKMGVFRAVADFANNKFIPTFIDDVYDGFLRDTFGTMPVMWALTLPEDYESAVKYTLGGHEEDYSKLIELSKEYRKMAEERESFLKAAENDGVSVIVAASYGIPCIPAYERGNSNGDGTLESPLMLGMAKVAPLGQTLGDDYEARCPERLSPDRVVDLSDALFPETTWAICGSPHVATSCGTDYSDFVFKILTYEGTVNVKTFDQYPQFMLSSMKQELRKP